MNGRLELILGPMFSGKSTELIKNVRLNKILSKKVLVLKPIIDNRYDSNRIVSHNKDKEDCIAVSDLIDIKDDFIKSYDVIIIDEGQFFKSLKLRVLKWTEMFYKYVIVGGLDGDYQRNPIGEILDLIPYADKYHKFCALCKYCNDGTKAIFSKRISNFGDQILIGSDDYYVPVCRYHFLQN